MRVIVQRVSEAGVTLPEEGDVSGQIARGLLVFVGLQQEDTDDMLTWMVHKLLNLRIFPDKDGKMNLCVTDIDAGGVLLVPNFTVGCDIGKGRRPSFDRAMPPDAAGEMFRVFAGKFVGKIGRVQTGTFGAHMHVTACNDGPVTFVIDAPKS